MAVSISQTISESFNIPHQVGDRVAVIVSTSGHCGYGVQFWTSEMMQAGQQQNTDGTISTFVQLLSDKKLSKNQKKHLVN